MSIYKYSKEDRDIVVNILNRSLNSGGMLYIDSLYPVLSNISKDFPDENTFRDYFVLFINQRGINLLEWLLEKFEINILKDHSDNIIKYL